MIRPAPFPNKPTSCHSCPFNIYYLRKCFVTLPSLLLHYQSLFLQNVPLWIFTQNHTESLGLIFYGQNFTSRAGRACCGWGRQTAMMFTTPLHNKLTVVDLWSIAAGATLVKTVQCDQLDGNRYGLSKEKHVFCNFCTPIFETFSQWCLDPLRHHCITGYAE